MILEMVGDLLFQTVADAIYGIGINARRARRAEKSIFLSGLRVVSGSQPGLGRRWKAGNWHIDAGRLVLTDVEVRAIGIVAGSHRRATLRESLGGWEETVIVTIRTPSADLEWSTLKRFDERASQALALPEVG